MAAEGAVPFLGSALRRSAHLRNVSATLPSLLLNFSTCAPLGLAPPACAPRLAHARAQALPSRPTSGQECQAQLTTVSVMPKAKSQQAMDAELVDRCVLALRTRNAGATDSTARGCSILVMGKPLPWRGVHVFK